MTMASREREGRKEALLGPRRILAMAGVALAILAIFAFALWVNLPH
jgi:hypothetical protein